MKLFKPRWVVRICIHKNPDKSDMDNFTASKRGIFLLLECKEREEKTFWYPCNFSPNMPHPI